MKTLTSFKYKPRVTKTSAKIDVASEIKWDKTESINKLKNKNSTLLAKYRKNLRTNEQDQDQGITKSHELTQEQKKSLKMIPKMKSTFRGVVFDDTDEIEFNHGKINSLNARKQNKQPSHKKSGIRNSTKNSDRSVSKSSKYNKTIKIPKRRTLNDNRKQTHGHQQ